jgi:hypothetical protein
MTPLEDASVNPGQRAIFETQLFLLTRRTKLSIVKRWERRLRLGAKR